MCDKPEFSINEEPRPQYSVDDVSKILEALWDKKAGAFKKESSANEKPEDK